MPETLQAGKAKSAARGADRTPAVDGRQRILDAALEEFAIHGFLGASIRQIAKRANAQHQLIIHHFGNKDVLWKTVVADQLRVTNDVYERILNAERVEGPTAALRILIREFVDWSAENPAFHRLVAYESQGHSERMSWLIRNYYSVLYQTTTRLIREAQKAGDVREGAPHRLYFAMTGMVNSRFQNTDAFRVLTGKNPLGRREIDAFYDLACDLLNLAP